MKQQSDKKINKIYFKNLDALRFIAAFSVFLGHYSADMEAVYPSLTENKYTNVVLSILDKGGLGVNFFFVLSGFLITYLILNEVKTKGKFNLGKFLVRRTLRIWPLYFIIVLVGFIIFPMCLPHYETTHNPIMYLFFLANFDEINNGLTDGINFLTSPWSVAVEEQFYLFWGVLLLVWFNIKRVSFPLIIAALYLFSFVFRAIYWEDERFIYYHTFAVFQDILTGSFVAWSLFEGKKWLQKVQDINRLTVVIIYIVGVVTCVAKNKIFANELIIVERFVLSLFFVFVILDQIRGKNSFIKFGQIKPFNFLGKISYGLYMYHLVLMYVLFQWMDSWGSHGYWLAVVYFVMSFVATVAIATISYYVIEKPLLKLKPH